VVLDIPGLHERRWSDLWRIGLPLLVSAVCMKLQCNKIVPMPVCAQRALVEIQVLAEKRL